VIVLAARILLAAVFAVAGVGKLARRGETEATLGKFGVAEALRAPLAVALPLVELVISAGLLPAASAPWAAAAALLLLAAFAVAVARVLTRQDEVDCNCFGSLAPSRVSGWTLARNGGLMVVAGLVAAAGWSDPGPSAVAWIGGLDATALVAILAGLALLAAALNFAFSWQLMKQNGRLVAELATLSAGGAAAPAAPVSLPLGEMAPSFELAGLSGRPVELDELLDAGHGLVLFFSDPGCNACEPLLPEIGRMQRDPDADPQPVVISLGDVEPNLEKVEQHGLELLLLQEDFELARSLGITGMPGAIVLDREGRIASEPAVGANAVATLLAGLSSPLRLVKVEAG
jgi:peroxiredoxin